jgi:catechol 2,3-dioxygenase-like lactoylglutathione lyase family enzyme
VLGDCKAIAFLGVSDLDQARVFYEEVLGLHIVSQDALSVVADAGGVMIRITQPQAVDPHVYTVLGFDVDDIAAKVRGLTARGVVFERYSFFGDSQDDLGVWTAPGGMRVAWFKDPDGNLLSLSEAPSPSQA